VDVVNYANRGKPNGDVVALPRGSGGGLVLFPSHKGPFQRAGTSASKMLIGPKSLENAYRAGYAKGLYGPWWCAPGPRARPPMVALGALGAWRSAVGWPAGCWMLGPSAARQPGAPRAPGGPARRAPPRHPAAAPRAPVRRGRVVAAGPSADPRLGYDWAVISGGAPSVPTLRGKCRTGDFLKTPLAGMKGDGLWLFTRNPIDPANTQAAVSAAERLGFDTHDLHPVVQRGCLYGAAPPAAAGEHKAGGARLEAGKQAAPKAPAAAPLPAVTRKVYFDLSQDGKVLGRVVLGL
jgi:hypothetical protein